MTSKILQNQTTLLLQSKTSGMLIVHMTLIAHVRVRSFLPGWLEGIPWLWYVPKTGDVVPADAKPQAKPTTSPNANGIMYCMVCKANTHGHADTNCSFSKGSTSFYLTSITKHQDSLRHKREKEACNVAKAPKEKSVGFRMLEGMNKLKLDRLAIKFRTVHALAKHHRPYTDYVWMLKLDALNGADVGKEYCNDKAAAIFAHHIAEVERERLIEQVETADFVSLISDGSTDAIC